MNLIKSLKNILQKLKRNKELVVLIAISGLGVMAGSIIAPIEAVFITTLTSSKILLGLTFSVGTFGIFIFSIFIGKINKKFSRQKLAYLGFLPGLSIL